MFNNKGLEVLFYAIAAAIALALFAIFVISIDVYDERGYESIINFIFDGGLRNHYVLWRLI